MGGSQGNFQWKKKANFKRLHSVLFHFYNILKATELEGWVTDPWLQGLGVVK